MTVAPKKEFEKWSTEELELGNRTVALLLDQWQASSYRGDDEYVFGHPLKAWRSTHRGCRAYTSAPPSSAPP